MSARNVALLRPAPLKEGIDPRELFDEAEFARRLEIFEERKKAALKRAGYRLSIREQIALAFSEYFAELRADPASHATTAILAIIGWTLALVAPLALGWTS